MKQRLNYIDYAKAFAIFCVVLGHSIQSLPHTHASDLVYSFIYSFHMPLFMTLSGFFIGKLFSQNILEVTLHKAKQLLLPVLSFSIVAFLVELVLPVDFTGENDFLSYLVGGDMWFLKYLFVCILVAYVSKLLFRNTLAAALIPTTILLLVTSVGIFHIYPYLWWGYCLYVYRDAIERHLSRVCLVSAVLFLALLPFWVLEYDYPNFVWMHIAGDGITIRWFDLYVILYRTAVGALGSLFFISLFQWLTHRFSLSSPFILGIGRNTLGIYCLQIYLLEDLFSSLPLPFAGALLSHVLICATAVFMTLLCHLLVVLLSKNKYTALLFLGR